MATDTASAPATGRPASFWNILAIAILVLVVAVAWRVARGDGVDASLNADGVKLKVEEARDELSSAAEQLAKTSAELDATRQTLQKREAELKASEAALAEREQKLEALTAQLERATQQAHAAAAGAAASSATAPILLGLDQVRRMPRPVPPPQAPVAQIDPKVFSQINGRIDRAGQLARQLPGK